MAAETKERGKGACEILIAETRADFSCAEVHLARLTLGSGSDSSKISDSPIGSRSSQGTQARAA